MDENKKLELRKLDKRGKVIRKKKVQPLCMVPRLQVRQFLDDLPYIRAIK